MVSRPTFVIVCVCVCVCVCVWGGGGGGGGGGWFPIETNPEVSLPLLPSCSLLSAISHSPAGHSSLQEQSPRTALALLPLHGIQELTGMQKRDCWQLNCCSSFVSRLLCEGQRKRAPHGSLGMRLSCSLLHKQLPLALVQTEVEIVCFLIL